MSEENHIFGRNKCRHTFGEKNRKMNLLSLIGNDGGTLRKVATTNGGEWAGSCPFCGGKDRFRVWPEEKGGKWWCRGCDRHGDAIDWLRERRGLSFLDACAFMGREPGPRTNGLRPEPLKWEPKEATTPGDHWQGKAGAFLNKARRTLWSEAGTEARAFLHGRGLTDETIKGAGLGWNPSDLYLDRASWGLPESLKENGTERQLWIPAGLVIPLMDEGKVARLRIRRPEGEPRYCLIPGSDTRPMTWNLERAAAVIVESELDGLLLNQEAGDLAGVVAMGSATAKPDRPTHDTLTKMEVILVSLDSDTAGAKASWKFWPETYGEKAKRWPAIQGKDPSEAWQNGLDLRAWIISGLFGTVERFERFCIQTVDGGLSDREALAACLEQK